MHQYGNELFGERVKKSPLGKTSTLSHTPNIRLVHIQAFAKNKLKWLKFK